MKVARRCDECRIIYQTELLYNLFTQEYDIFANIYCEQCRIDLGTETPLPDTG